MVRSSHSMGYIPSLPKPTLGELISYVHFTMHHVFKIKKIPTFINMKQCIIATGQSNSFYPLQQWVFSEKQYISFLEIKHLKMKYALVIYHIEIKKM